ncbi:lysophospholipase L1-like esterase [Flavobacterium sp. CG_9.1]|uniref:Lysophospholipase L1 n=1 Tax=Flavobacterium xanthum TaxID=69322 RepID=A0A1M6Z4Q9_9FLAO|nr:MULTISPECIES: SGNH/GDSL hydrolase family protein [Flavobacterium]MBG6063321.1 lysophospholipase L1-like esterase [Flavobacterium sp. CG_9.1]SHL25484.1 Lysophospholipase L1 [Flavobacterium xanthum]
MKKIQFLYSILFLSIIMGGKAQAQDWPNLSKYQEENAQLQPVAPGEKRIVFMGDSITEFWSTIDSEYFTGKPYLNRGISGQTTPQMLIRFRADVIDLKPSAVVILAGINDIAGNTGPVTLQMITNNIVSMVELAHVNQIKVILCSVLPAYDFPWKPNQNPAQKVVDLNKMIKKYAEAKGILYLDYFSAMRDERDGLKSAYSGDGVHPNKLGYQVMAPLAEKAIKEVLVEK